MTNSKSPFPVLPTPPLNYEPRYINDLVRALTQYIALANNPGEGRFTGSVFTNLQDHDSGLEAGAIYESGGFLRVSRLDTVGAQGNNMALSLGDVTVTIT